MTVIVLWYNNIMKIKLESRLNRKNLALVKKAGGMADAAGVRAYLAGGIVRDMLSGRKSGDVDITIEGDAMEFARAFADSLGAAYRGFERFGSGKVFLKDGSHVDFTSARSEIYSHKAALPEIKLTNLENDLFRRDFAVNAMAICINKNDSGLLYDPFGGVNDLKNRILRALHAKSFLDDPIRILRGIRFEERFGFRMEKNTVAFLREALREKIFDRVPGERLRDELLLFFREPEPLKPLIKLEKLGITRGIHPGIKVDRTTGIFLKRMGEFMAVQEGPEIGTECMLSIARSPGAMRRLKTGASWIKAAEDLEYICKHMARSSMKRSAIYSVISGKALAAIYFFAFILAPDVNSKKILFLAKNSGVIRPDVTGEDLKKLGIHPGPLYSRLLSAAFSHKIDGDAPEKAQQLELIKKMAAGVYKTGYIKQAK
jgi:tRNA nucleotidyltransferase (CCA-adding enzyme)